MYWNRRIAVFAPGAVAFIAFLAVSSFSISGTHLGLEAAIAADDQAAPAKDAAPAPAKEAAPAPAESTLPDMAIGKADAPITIVEYSSLSCPHCGAFHKDVLPSLKSEYIDTGKVR